MFEVGGNGRPGYDGPGRGVQAAVLFSVLVLYSHKFAVDDGHVPSVEQQLLPELPATQPVQVSDVAAVAFPKSRSPTKINNLHICLNYFLFV